MRIYLKSVKEFTQDFAPIAYESAVECARDAAKWAGQIIMNKIDEWDRQACDALNGPEDEL